MAPEKWKPDEVKVDRHTKKVTRKRHYLRSTPTQELQDYLEKSYTKPKVIQKIQKELRRRSERARSE